jgi:hypothetical protein
MLVKQLFLIVLGLGLGVACADVPATSTTSGETPAEPAAPADGPAAVEAGPGDLSPGPAEAGPPGPVAILLVDDFQTAGGGDVQAFLETSPSQRQEGNCTVTPDGQGHFFTAGMGHFFTVGMSEYAFFAGIPHGRLVYTRALDELAKSVGDPQEFIATGDFYDRLLERVAAGEIDGGSWTQLGLEWLQGLQRWEADGQALLMAAVDTGGYNTAIIADRIRAAMEALAVSDWQVNSFVINMSFAIIPCDSGMSLSDYQGVIDGDDGLARLQQLLKDNLGSDEAALIFASRMVDLRMAYEQAADDAYVMSTQGKEDPLFQLLVDPPYRVAQVASSGNFRHLGFEYPFAPAMWPEVTSVGAEAAYANPAEVIMEDSVVFEGRTAVGTSFSAPAFSVQAALYLLNGGPQSCQGDAGSSLPPLSYASETGPWRNLPLSDAAQEYCQQFGG